MLAKLTSKNQLTIPKKALDALGPTHAHVGDLRLKIAKAGDGNSDKSVSSLHNPILPSYQRASNGGTLLAQARQGVIGE